MITLFPFLLLLAADPVRKADAITLDGTAGTFTLKIATGSVTTDVLGNSQIEGFTVEDIDGADKKKEIAVHSVGENDDDHLVIFYGWDGKKIGELGRVPPFEDLKGNGVVLVNTWAGFWKRTEKHILDPKTHKIVDVPQEMYYVGVEATVRKTFPLQKSRGDKAIIANVADKSTVMVVAMAPVTTGAKPKETTVNWYLVKTASGLMGWTTEVVLNEGVELPWAG